MSSFDVTLFLFIKGHFPEIQVFHQLQSLMHEFNTVQGLVATLHQCGYTFPRLVPTCQFHKPGQMQTGNEGPFETPLLCKDIVSPHYLQAVPPTTQREVCAFSC